jgi:uncharacterized protein with LGFP repeats
VVTERLVNKASELLSHRLGRRGFLVRSAVVGSALATSGLDYVLKPQSAYASVCGSGASCSSGWTAMCCTIHEGVNQCPPGSFAGGWWKADGASLCGGKARYYIDCQGECTHCGCGGGAFCASHCLNCRSHCADGSCDKRHVCHNVFRYGQCDRSRHCSGPVLCRAISCTPPWKWADCSDASATDDATRSHSASCLSDWTHIAKRYTALGSQGSVLGATVNGELTSGHAKIQHYVHGRMYWSNDTGAHYLIGRVVHRYDLLGQNHSPLGLPTSDATRLPDNGLAAHFQHGAVYERPNGNAHAVWGTVYTKWHQRGDQTGPLGYPTSDVVDLVSGGVRASFVHGGIYNGPHTATHAVWGPIYLRYVALDAQAGLLGFPTSDVLTNADGVGSHVRFVDGIIELDPAGDVHALWGAVASAYIGLGEAASALGYPTTDIQTGDGTSTPATFAMFATFVNGSPTVSGSVTLAPGAATAFGVWGAIYQTWQQNGGATGAKLGYPITDVTTNSAGTQVCHFEHGTITYDPANPPPVVTGP